MSIQRVNFNMASECHALLKSACAMKNTTISDYCYNLIAEDFANSCRIDPQFRQLLAAGEYPVNSRAAQLKIQIESEFSFE